MTGPDKDLSLLRCSVQGALLEAVTVRLLAVTAGYEGTLIRLIAYFQSEPTDEEKQDIWNAGGYIVGDHDSSFQIEEEFRSGENPPLEVLDFWAFRRRVGPRRPRPIKGDVYSPHLLANLYCAFQEALLDEITAGLTRVTAAVIDRQIDVLAYFNRPITEDDQQTFADVAARVAACFPVGCSVRPRCLPWRDARPQPELSEYPEDSVFTVFAVKGS
jgi:hypothetical protein